MAAPAGRREVFINGAWVAPALGGTLDVVNPADESVIGAVGAATAADVDAAVKAARAAFKTWKRTRASERAAIIRKVAALVRERKPELAALEARDCGKPLEEALWDIEDVAGCFEYFADRAEEVEAANPVAVRHARAAHSWRL